jgi:S-adenosylmethionine synthetase
MDANGTRWLDEDHAYDVVSVRGHTEVAERKGLSHPDAMRLAESLRRDGKVAVVKHVVGDQSYEVDRYPLR